MRKNGIDLTPHPNKSLIPNIKFKALKSKLKPNTKASDLVTFNFANVTPIKALLNDFLCSLSKQKKYLGVRSLV